MRIERTLADLIARAAITEPYRQHAIMATRDFARWLKARDLPYRWHTLHHLWAAGILRPIAVLEPALLPAARLDTRFVPTDLGFEVGSYLDLGTEASAQVPFTPPLEFPPTLADCLLWHPLQLPLLERFAAWMAMSLPHVSLDDALEGPEECGGRIAAAVERVPHDLAGFADNEWQQTGHKILALLLLAEPLVHTEIDHRLCFRPALGESLDGYYSWRDVQDGAGILGAVGLAASTAAEWHGSIARTAQYEDPLAEFRVLIRHAARRKRERLKGRALLAHDLYDAAEVLRRYLERYHGERLVEEDDVFNVSQSPDAKRYFYGSPRTADFDRAVFRRIARDFDLDPQARATWFLEGATEEGFVRRFAQHRRISLLEAGVELMDLEGIGGLASNRFRLLLGRLQREEVFAFVSIDREQGGHHIGLVGKYAADGLLPAGYKVWNPDFESANFTLPELAAVATAVAAAGGVELAIAPEQLEEVMRGGKVAVGEAIKRLWGRGHFYGGKGAIWGEALADWAAGNPCPVGVADSTGRRPVEALVADLLTVQQSHYQATVREYEIDQSGQLVKKPRADVPDARPSG